MINLVDHPLPVYDADWEAEHGLPDPARTLQLLVTEHHGLLIATPEHNGGYTALLKNAIDWISRPDEAEPGRRPVLAGRIAALLSVSTEALGGLRSQIALQITLNKLGVLVIPASFGLGAGQRACDDDGHLADSTKEAAIRNCGATLVRITGLLMREGDDGRVTPPYEFLA
jgi:NAD(P)H-dependent FMN reductase